MDNHTARNLSVDLLLPRAVINRLELIQKDPLFIFFYLQREKLAEEKTIIEDSIID